MAANQWDEDVWSFGNDRLYPVVKWVTGYDATAETFSCVQTMLPDGQTCGNPLPGQHDSDDDGTQDMVPAAPATPTVSSTVFTITITWTALADPAITAYHLYRNATEGDNALGNRPIATVAASEPLTYTDSAPLDGANYYAVSAVNVAGEGRAVAIGKRYAPPHRQRWRRTYRYRYAGRAQQYTLQSRRNQLQGLRGRIG